jgi:aspartyl-tRNA synthetase
MEEFGTDKPDLRNPLRLKDVSGAFGETAFPPFKDSSVKAILLPGAASQPRRFFDDITKFAAENGAKTLAWVKWGETLSGGVAKHISDAEKAALEQALSAKQDDAVLFLTADGADALQKVCGAVVGRAGKQLNLYEEKGFSFCWIVDFPMYEKNEETGAIEFSHNPFSMPQGGMSDIENKDPLDILAYQYDIVCNGTELSSGAVRNHDPELMVKAFAIAGYDKSVVESKFPALFNAFQYGAPPHAGIAPGVDRIVMLLAGEPSIREVIEFPLNKSAKDLLMGAPSAVTEKQLKDTHIKLLEE